MIKKLFRDKILILDGAMGTMVQSYKLEESDFRNERFSAHDKDLKGNNDLLCLTQPEIVGDTHYDTAQNVKNRWDKRNRIRTKEGWIYLTIPVIGKDSFKKQFDAIK